MAMLKGLRKHNKWILVVGGSLLMVAWLMPQTIRQLGPARKGAPQGEVDGQTIYQSDLARQGSELRALRTLIPSLIGAMVDPSRNHESAHWMLLTREADEA